MGEGAALDVLFDGWQAYQDGLVKAIESLTDDRLSIRVAPELRTAGAQLQHIVATRAGWFHGDLGMGGDEWREIALWDEEGARQRSAAELRGGLESTWRLIRESLATWSPDDLTASVHSSWPGQEDEVYVRGWVVWHVLEHDLHHGGELGFLLGMHGLPAPRI